MDVTMAHKMIVK